MLARTQLFNYYILAMMAPQRIVLWHQLSSNNMTPTDIDQSLLELVSKESDPQTKDRIKILRLITQNLNEQTEILDNLLRTISERNYGTAQSH